VTPPSAEEIMKRLYIAALLLSGVFCSAPAFAQGTPGTSPTIPLFDLKVRVVVQTAPGSYAAVNVPAGAVISTAPTGIINCPAAAGLAWATTTTDCSRTGIASNSSVMLQALFAIPNAHFLTWTDIMPPLPGTYAIANGCIYAATQTPPPNIKCTMAGMRNIQAVYVCNTPTPKDPATYVYDDGSKTCTKKGTGTPCTVFSRTRTSCGFSLQIDRGKKSATTYTVSVTPSSPLLSANMSPSTASQCVNAASGALVTGCTYFYNTSPTNVTLTAIPSSGSLPSGYSWTGCTSIMGAQCTVNVVSGASNAVVLHLPW
jgi:hypothetical protein